MQDIFGSVRRSLVFRTSTTNGDDGRFGGFVEKIGSSLRKSRVGLFSKPPVPALSPRAISKEDVSQIRWRRGELIGCGAFGRVYMGMNLDSGELLAIKQVLIAAHSASKETTQVNIRELEEEVKLLKNLSHPNIVRYLGTAREDDSLNILLEFVPGGSISSLLGKFGSFPEPVIIMYTKQLLLGLEYLHKNGIMHRDIKGANILVDNKGCIKLADFGASKKVVELATMTGAKSMKGTPYWMAPEVILQTGHSFSADIWSVGCTVIEMATGKPPWSQQYQEVAALFHIGTTKSHPPIPEHLSSEAKDFLLKCLQKEPDLRSSASDLLQHPFVTGEFQELRPVVRTSVMVKSGNKLAIPGMDLKQSTTCTGFKDVGNMGSVRCSTVYPDNYLRRGSFWGSTNDDDDMCVMDDLDDIVVGTSMKFNTVSTSVDCNKSFNPMCEPGDEWSYKYDERPLEISSPNLESSQSIDRDAVCSEPSRKDGMDFTFPCGTVTCEDDDEVTDTKIRAFLDEKALDLKKLQTPLYEEFLNTVNAVGSPSAFKTTPSEKVINISTLPPKSKSPNQVPRRRLSSAVGSAKTTSHSSPLKRLSNIDGVSNKTLHEIQLPQVDECKGHILDSQQQPASPSVSFSERQKKWKEELDEELARKREMRRQEGAGGNTSSPKDKIINKQRERLRFTFTGR